MSVKWRIALGLGLAATLALAGCRDPLGSSSDPNTLTLGRSVERSIQPPDTAWYQIAVGPVEPVVVGLSAYTGSMTLQAYDGNGRVVGTVVNDGIPPLVSESLLELIAPGATRFRLAVAGDGQFRLRVSPTPAGPERAGAQVVLGNVIEESIDSDTDADEFFLYAPQGELVIGYLQALGPNGDDLRMGVFDGNRQGVRFVTTNRLNQDAEAHTTERLAIETTPYRFRVVGPYVGPYRLKVLRINLAPETAPSSMAPNDTTFGDRLDYAGDIDEFTLAGPPNTQFNVFVRLGGGDSTRAAQVEVARSPRDPVFLTARTTGLDTALAEHGSGRFSIDLSGTVTVRVLGSGSTRGPYRLFAYQVDPRPDGPKKQLASNDTSLVEAIDWPGDVDEFELDVAAPDTINTLLRWDRAIWPDTTRPPIQLSILGPRGEVIFGGNLIGGALPLAPRRHRVQVAGIWDQTDGYKGPYRLTTYRIRNVPESGSATTSLEQPVEESIGPAGDEDRYELTLARGDHVDLRLQQLEGTPLELYAGLTRVRDSALIGSVTTDRGPDPNLEAHGSGRRTIAESGRYRIEVSAVGGVASETPGGRYRAVVRRYPSNPERHAANIVVGDTVTDERLDSPGDVDEFLLTGNPGREVTIAVGATGPFGVGAPWYLVDPTTKELISWRGITQFGGWITRMNLPPTGRVIIRVVEANWPRFEPDSTDLPYRLLVAAIDSAPEIQPKTIAIGDSTAVEPLDPPGDIDEFRFTAAPGDQLRAYLDSESPGYLLQVLRPDGTVITEALTFEGEPGFGQSARFTIPSFDTYRLRIKFANEQAQDRGSYRIALRRATP